MAVIKNLWLRQSKQKLAGAVTYQLKGQTIAREQAANVANPRTTAQMNQRVRLANLVNFYRANRPWMHRGAFESKKRTWSDYNAFVSLNIQGSNIALTKAEAAAGACVAAPYVLTRGTLGVLDYAKQGNGIDLQVPGMLAGANMKWGTFCEYLMDAYPWIQEGDQFTLVHITNKRDTQNIPRLVVKYSEAPIDLNDDQSSIAGRLVPQLAGVSFEAAAGKMSIATSAVAGVADAFAVIISRTVGGVIKVSNQSLVVVDDTFIDGYSGEEQFNKANASYGEETTDFLDSVNAEVGSSNSGGNPDQGGSGAGDPGDVTP